jgi:hypothetical protein
MFVALPAPLRYYNSTATVHGLSRTEHLQIGPKFVAHSNKQIWNLANQIVRHHNDFKLKSCELQSYITFRDLQLLFWSLLHPKYLTTTTQSLVTIEYIDSLSINSIKSYGIYLDIQTISNQKSFNYKVVDLTNFYNFGIKFVFIGHNMRKLWSFSCSGSDDPISLSVHG